jgi:hypothetical protein
VISHLSADEELFVLHIHILKMAAVLCKGDNRLVFLFQVIQRLSHAPSLAIQAPTMLLSEKRRQSRYPPAFSQPDELLNVPSICEIHVAKPKATPEVNPDDR